MEPLRKLIGLGVLIASMPMVGEISGTYVVSFGEELSPGGVLTNNKGKKLLEEWNVSAANEEVTLQFNPTEIKHTFNAIWTDSTPEEVETLVASGNPNDSSFIFVFKRKVDDLPYLFLCKGDIENDELLGTVKTVWGDVPIAGTKLETVDIRGTYVLSFGETLEEAPIKKFWGIRLLEEWRKSARTGEVILEILDADVENQLEMVWTDSTTDALEDNPGARFIPSGKDFIFVFTRVIDEVPFWFLCEGEVVDGELQGVLKTVWGDVEITGKLVTEDHSKASEG